MTTEHFTRAYKQFSSCTLEIGRIADLSTGHELTSSRNTAPLFGPRTIDLTRADGWHIAQIEVAVLLPESELHEVLAEGEDGDSLEVLAVIASGPSKFREATRLARTSSGEWKGTVTIHRDRVFGSFEIGGRVCREKDLAPAKPPRASFAGVILGEASPVEVLIDEIERPYNGLIQFSWINFDESADERFSSSRGSLLLVETSKAPTIFLNSAVEGFQAALESTQKTGSIAVARQALASLVAAQSWQAFLTSAVSAIDHDEESDSCFVDPGWKGTLAKRAAKAMYPSSDEDEALRHTYEAWHDSSSTDVVISRLASFAQAWSKTRNLVQRAINAVDPSAE